MSAIFGEVLTFGQQNGPEVRLRVFGDEHYARYEDLEGYTVVYDRDLGAFCYARLAADRFRSTGIAVSQPPPAGLVRHLQEPDAVRATKAQARLLAKTPVGISARDSLVRTLGPDQGLLEGRRLSSGPVRGLTILVNFQDVQSTVTSADVDAMLNGANYTANGNICSVREYFTRMSSGKLDYNNVVVGPYTLSRNRQFYVNTLLIEEALALAVADGLDLTQFDSRNEGIVDALNVLYAGQTQYLGELWPHNYFINLRHGNVRTDLYLLSSLGRTPADLSIGTFCHENGHLLCRFPDMYDYGERDGDSVRSAGIGVYCLMGSGNHLDFGRSPSPVCSYLRDLAGWCDNEVNLNTAGAYQVQHGDYNTVVKYRTSKPNEYFLIENRSRMNMDQGLPASGLAVYHCDVLGSNELQQGTAAQHYQCALLQADGHRDLELNVNRGDGNDLFGELSGLVLTSQSAPHTREWDGRDSRLTISNITAPGDAIRFQVGQSAMAAAEVGEARPMMPIPDNRSAGIASIIPIAASGIVRQIKVSVDIEHPFIGDLDVALVSPSGRRATLHARLGGSRDNLVETYASSNPGVLATMIGQPMQGDWMLRVADRARQDVGTLRSWRIELSSGAAAGAPLESEAFA
jgi:M6 family metalloprotease-like protein